MYNDQLVYSIVILVFKKKLFMKREGSFNNSTFSIYVKHIYILFLASSIHMVMKMLDLKVHAYSIILH